MTNPHTRIRKAIRDALQSSQTPDDLAKSLGRVPDYTGAENPASPLGAIAQAVQEVTR